MPFKEKDVKTLYNKLSNMTSVDPFTAPQVLSKPTNILPKYKDTHNECSFLVALQKLVNLGETENISNDRTGVGTYRLFGETFKFDLNDNRVPLFTTKKINWKAPIQELLWMYIMGNPDTSYLDSNNIKIWDEWKVPKDDTFTIGEMYGQVVRNFKVGDGTTIDQLQEAIDILKRNPNSRRAVFTTLDPRSVAKEELSFEENVAEGRGVLNSCHGVFNQIIINSNGNLELLTVQRSADSFIGFQYNTVFYGVLAHMLAQVLGIKASKLIYVVGDFHLYANHIEQAKLQLARKPYDSPRLELNTDIKNIDDFTINDFNIINYLHHPFIKAPVAI